MDNKDVKTYRPFSEIEKGDIVYILRFNYYGLAEKMTVMELDSKPKIEGTAWFKSLILTAKDKQGKIFTRSIPDVRKFDSSSKYEVGESIAYCTTAEECLAVAQQRYDKYMATANDAAKYIEFIKSRISNNKKD